jgi:outer membrane protein assembly factor BamD (BamD/ComL family)
VPSQADAARTELRLLQQARAAVAQGDFTGALPLITEHARRFQNGRLAEEREALRVKTLSRLGRTDEARHAAAAFKARFPNSVLLPAVSQMPDSGR